MVIIDCEVVGFGFVVYLFVKLVVFSCENMEIFDKLVYYWLEVVICEWIIGVVDYLIKVVIDDIKIYDDFFCLKLFDNMLVFDV